MNKNLFLLIAFFAGITSTCYTMECDDSDSDDERRTYYRDDSSSDDEPDEELELRNAVSVAIYHLDPKLRMPISAETIEKLPPDRQKVIGRNLLHQIDTTLSSHPQNQQTQNTKMGHDFLFLETKRAQLSQFVSTEEVIDSKAYANCVLQLIFALARINVGEEHAKQRHESLINSAVTIALSVGIIGIACYLQWINFSGTWQWLIHKMP